MDDIQQNDNPELFTNNNGDKIWKLNGRYHREDGPAIEWSNGKKFWCLNGKPHRENGPAFETVETKGWALNGKRHRIDGPAIIHSNGGKEWWLNGLQHSQDEWFQQLTPEQQWNYLWNLDEQF
jgi:hypothetical protein